MDRNYCICVKSFCWLGVDRFHLNHRYSYTTNTFIDPPHYNVYFNDNGNLSFRFLNITSLYKEILDSATTTSPSFMHFQDYFMTIEEYRDSKINQLIDAGQRNL